MVIGPPSVQYLDMMARRGTRSLEVPQENKVFVGGLSWNTDDRMLFEHFAQYGDVYEAYVAVSADKTPRGFGFVSFCRPEVADRVCSLNHTIDDRPVRGSSERVFQKLAVFFVYTCVSLPQVEVKKAVPKDAMGTVKTPPGEQRKLFIGGLAPATQTSDLFDYFSRYGHVDDAVVMLDHVTKRPRGFGFVTFSSPACARKVKASFRQRCGSDTLLMVHGLVRYGRLPAGGCFVGVS